MKTRKWILILTGSVVALIAIAYISWRMTAANERIKALILERVRPYLAQETDIANMDVGVSSIHFRDVVVAPKDHSFRLEIEEISLGYNLLNLFRFRFAPHRVPHEVVLIRPTLIVRPFALAETGSDSASANVDLKAVASEILGVRRITLANARIVVEDSSGQRARLAHDLNGWLSAARPDSAQVRLSGHIFNSPDKNVEIQSRINLLGGRVQWAKAVVNRSEPAEQMPMLLPDFVRVSSGVLYGEITYDQFKGAGGHINLDETNFTLTQANLVFEDVTIHGQIRPDALDFNVDVTRFNDSPLHVKGSLGPLLNPRLDAELTAPDFLLESFFNVLMGEGAPKISGKVHAGITARGPLAHPEVVATLQGRNLEIYAIPLDDFSAALDYKARTIRFDSEGSQENGVSLYFDGNVAFDPDSIRTNVDVRLMGDAARLFPSEVVELLPACLLDWRLHLEGPIRHMSGTGEGRVVPRFASGDSLRLFPRFTWASRAAQLTVTSPGPLHVAGEVSGVFSPDVAWNLEAKGLESLLLPLAGDAISNFLENVTIAGGFDGRPDAWRVYGLGRLPSDSGIRTVLDFELHSEAGTPRPMLVAGRYFGDDNQPVNWSISALNEAGRIVIRKAAVSDWLKFEGHIPLSTRVPQRGRLSLEDFTLAHLHGTFSKLKPYSGDISGGITWSGNAETPRMNVELTLRNGTFFSRNLYEGEVKMSLEKGLFHNLDLALRRNDQALFEGAVSRGRNQMLSGRLHGEAIDWGDLVFALTGKRNVLSGTGDLAVDVGGTADSPLMTGTFTAANGTLGPFSFRQMELVLADSTTPGRAFPSGHLTIQRGLIERNDDLRVMVWGRLSHGSPIESDISLLGQGNVLALLTDLTPFVKKTTGKGDLLMRFDHSREGWALGSARFDVTQSTMHLDDLTPVVKNIQGRGELAAENRFFRIEEITADVEDGHIRLFNTFHENDAPLFWSTLGLELGRIHWQTPGKGVKLHIPGLMDDDDRGWFVFEGKDGNDDVLLTGPSSNPRLIGRLRIREQRLTYPFLESKGGGSGSGPEFLTKLDWDVDVVPDKDVRYFRQVDNPLGNVYVDLQMRQGLGGLHFEGIIDQSTFMADGNLVSTEGTVEVFDHLFRPERITFEYPKGSESPFIYGRAFTTIIDSVGVPSTVWLNITSTDDDTGIRRDGGPWETVRFRFSTDNPNLGRTEADLMAALGYSTSHFRDRAYMALGMQVENRLFRPIFRPLEKSLRKHLGLDVVHLSSMFSRNIFRLNSISQTEWDPWTLLRSTKFTLGKYFSPGFFITYSGQIHDGYNYRYPIEGRLGMRHALILEYTIRSDLFLEMEYTYDTQLLSERREDKRIWLRHVFPF